MTYLITGGCGFLGTNIAERLLLNNEEVIIYDNFSRLGSKFNYEWLKTKGNFTFYNSDIRNADDVLKVIKEHKPATIFHLAGQVAMTTSIQNPRNDFEINALGSLNVLEAVRNTSMDSTIIYSSTNKVYGDLESLKYRETTSRYICDEYPNGLPETITLDFHSPYGCSKGAADQYMLDYHRIFGLKTIVFRHSSMFGGRQFSSYDQGWIGWFCQKALDVKNNINKEPFNISGNGKQVRDVLYAKDMVDLYLSASASSEHLKGEAFNIGGGNANSLSLLELFSLLENQLDTTLNYTKLPFRESDQKIFIADLTKINTYLNWTPSIDKQQGISMMLEWMRSQNND